MELSNEFLRAVGKEIIRLSNNGEDDEVIGVKILRLGTSLCLQVMKDD